jgi:hypothetical protein
MTAGSDRWQELDSLLDRVLDGLYDDRDLRRLNEILRGDVEASRRYMLYVQLHGRLAWGEGLGAAGNRETCGAMPLEMDAALDDDACRQERPHGSSPLIPILIETSPGIPSSISPYGSFLFSYAVAAATVVIGLLIGWTCQVPFSPIVPQPIAKQDDPRPTPLAPRPTLEKVLVGQITGVFDPRWVDRSAAAIEHASVPLGGRYALASGLIEITYNTGVKVILQGPCVYRVDSRASGFLEIGKMTARVDTKAEGGRRKAEQSASDNLSPLSPLPSPLFSVRTPSAVISDLGTEFGVEVDASGASQAHVFRGKVEVRAAAENVRAVSLQANQSARVVPSKGRAAEVVRLAGRRAGFVREMPKLTPIALFNTGLGLKGGDADPHWQIVARSDDPAFKPQPAVVRGMKPDDYFLKDNPDRSQWLSLLPGDRNFPEDVIFVFRTTFDLTGMLPTTAVLSGRFMADDHIVGMRLNGRRLPVPVHHDGGPFLDLASFRITSGFVKGKNVLEFDVLNANPYLSPSQRRTAKSRMSFRAELQGGAMSDPSPSGDEPLKTSSARPRPGKMAAINSEK